ncbi:MAG TPA: tetraacyldisaccharide 4'-kinase, partial [Labilithrix sp.]|nr:tetraacyldisaccharide 4'-kinase [Labilithrix sp.]
GLVRPAHVPAELALVCVGGATIGGSGKTRVAIECARELASRGLRVALVGHAYHAAPAWPRVVSPEDALVDVGDEAIVCARALGPWNVPVVVGPTRQAAIDYATALPAGVDALVLDGPLGIRGRTGGRTLTLLAVDANRPWGSGRLPPSGDLRAPRELLLSHADHVVPVDPMPTHVRWRGGETTSVRSLRTMSLGLFTAIARPDRLIRALAAAGIHPREVVSVDDHGPLRAEHERVMTGRVDAWIATQKCALHLDGVDLGGPVGVLEGNVELPPPIVAALAEISVLEVHPGRAETACEDHLHTVP